MQEQWRLPQAQACTSLLDMNVVNAAETSVARLPHQLAETLDAWGHDDPQQAATELERAWHNWRDEYDAMMPEAALA